jgi:hypothetical protein
MADFFRSLNAAIDRARPRHSFGRRWLDAPSLQPERVPAHRAPKHRADAAVDRCRHWRAGSQPLSCLECRRSPLVGGAHRAEERAS